MKNNSPIALPVETDAAWRDDAIWDVNGHWLCDAVNEECAKAIVTAVNAYDDLVASCEAARKLLDEHFHEYIECVPETRAIYDQLVAALAGAQEAAS